jgi:uridine phosphorylase
VESITWNRSSRVGEMPRRLRPTAALAADAILVGDPGRALLLAQELLDKPKMSNHARGLWGYSGEPPGGSPLTIQSTGMGGPSARVVLADLAELGVRRGIRVGTCAATGPGLGLGDLVVVSEAHAWPRPEGSRPPRPDPVLTGALAAELGASAREAAVASLDALHNPGRDDSPAVGEVADMQTAGLLAGGEELGVALAAVLVVAEAGGEGCLDDERLERAAKAAGRAAATILSA